MLLLIGVVLTLIWTAWKEIHPLWKKDKRKEAWILALATVCISVLGIAKSLNAPLPNPLIVLSAILGPYPQAVYSILQ